MLDVNIGIYAAVVINNANTIYILISEHTLQWSWGERNWSIPDAEQNLPNGTSWMSSSVLELSIPNASNPIYNVTVSNGDDDDDDDDDRGIKLACKDYCK